ncbi:unnamed protein product, partial [Prorocentrum cordatum]
MKGLLYVSLSTSTVLQVEALQLDRDGQPVRRVDDDIISGYPSRPGCYFRQPSKCPARPMKTSMWRRDTWAEEHGVDEAGCRDRKGFWDRYCEAEDTKVVHIGGEDGDVPDPQSPDPGQILRAGCYFRQPSKCPAKPMKTSMWRHDAWAEQRVLNETECKERKAFWDRYCETSDTKVMYIRGSAASADSSVLR